MLLRQPYNPYEIEDSRKLISSIPISRKLSGHRKRRGCWTTSPLQLTAKRFLVGRLQAWWCCAADRLRELRVERALTLRALAERSGVSYDTINKLELGQRPARLSTIRKVTNALNVDPRELMKGKEYG